MAPCEYNLRFPALLPVPGVEQILSVRARMDSRFFLGDICTSCVFGLCFLKLAFPISLGRKDFLCRFSSGVPNPSPLLPLWEERDKSLLLRCSGWESQCYKLQKILGRAFKTPFTIAKFAEEVEGVGEMAWWIWC